jgi:predicted DNA-binding transcriptional regulator YafY
MKDDPFQIKIEFSGHAAKHVKERIWSHDQIIKEKKGEKIELIFTATSIVETLSWVMSFGHEATVIEPDWFVEEVKDEIQKAAMLYS